MSERVVLVAEDSLVVRALLRSQLVEGGYTVVEAGDGEEALERARESVPDVIVLDVEMPVLDGFAVIEELKRDPRLAEVPVIFLTGRTASEDAIRGLAAGAHDYLRKPFEPTELAARVQAAVRTKELQDQLREVNVELEHQARTDALTGLPNRRHLDDQMAALCSRSARHDRPLALLLIDADRFKSLNDTYGHRAGDRALIAIAGRLQRRLRREDVLGRWGGEEFLVIAPDIGEPGALALAGALRSVVAATPLPLDGQGEVALTVSVGVAMWRGETPEELLRRADAALYEAKDAGRDCVRSAGSTFSP